MDLGIKELGITFLVGAFTILGLEAILHHFFDVPLTGFFKGRLGLGKSEEQKTGDESKGAETGEKDVKKEDVMRAAVFVGLAFGIGILAEDLSYKYVDSVRYPLKVIPAALTPNNLIDLLELPSRYDSRVRTLINTPWGNPSPQWLAVDLARAGAFSMADPDNGPRVEQWIQNPGGCKPAEEDTGACPSFENVSDSIRRLYYLAKNTVYTNDNYYDEMKRIQMRLEFSRSISMLSFVYFVTAVLLGLFTLLLRRKRMRAGLSSPLYEKAGRRVTAVLAILLLVFFFSTWAYERESSEFNKRAFGYYSSMLLTGKDKVGANARP